jgi:hypothetical protein
VDLFRLAPWCAFAACPYGRCQLGKLFGVHLRRELKAVRVGVRGWKLIIGLQTLLYWHERCAERT